MKIRKNREKLQITHLHVFPYSAKAGTPASKMPQVFLEERRKRAKALRKLGNQNYLNNLQKQTFTKPPHAKQS